MWRKVLSWMFPTHSGQLSNLEDKVKALEASAARIEALAEYAEKEALLRKRIATARNRIKKVAPSGGTNRTMLIIVVVVILVVIVAAKTCGG